MHLCYMIHFTVIAEKDLFFYTTVLGDKSSLLSTEIKLLKGTCSWCSFRQTRLISMSLFCDSGILFVECTFHSLKNITTSTIS